MTPAELNGTTEEEGQQAPGKSGQVKRGEKRKRSGQHTSNGGGYQSEDEEYEVEGIVAHRTSPNKSSKNLQSQVTYYVKWKGWGYESNTWEKIDNLKNSLESVVEYHENLLEDTIETSSLIESFKHSLIKDITSSEIELLANRYIKPKGDCFPEIDEKDLDDRMQLLARLPLQSRDQKLVKELKSDYLILELLKRRTAQKLNLKQWEEEINRISSDSAPIKVENRVDLEWRPMDFKYINKCTIMNLPEKILTEPITGCECTNCSKGKCECASRDGSVFGYNNLGLLKVPKGVAIYECTELCKCGTNCANRILQKGRTIPLCIFKTNNGCGWGVKTISDVPKGQFVTEYVGEIISQEESDQRGKRYTREGRTYLFDLDFNGKDCKYTIDAAEYGNASHFINHSCSPNLEVRAVYVNCIDAALPRLGLFAIRNIRANEEITFDYLCQPVNDRRGDSSSEPKVKCKCNAKNCRTYLF